ncbi:3-isopropylmalate dehydratase small subunit [Helicobacter monodelphidis]|uniref:3-isopropylmalate dehydratase small subunit n=1 Tax=Helicobacter sp. 15-1451 TaxID=2004995 RepID=UPI0023B9C1CC|nr:3-isopropylmalate dehydratase small subunit [Helicobacter sp. 15-1451]
MSRAWKFGDNIDTDVIIAARYLNTSDPAMLAQHIMEDVRPDFLNVFQKGDIIVGGKNFGCGSSREHAPIALKSAGVKCVIAEGFARIFYRNAFNTGFPILEVAQSGEIQEGDSLEVNMADGIVFNKTQQKQYRFKPIPPFMQELLSAGGLIDYAKLKLSQGVV